jgi:hypothetical protein
VLNKCCVKLLFPEAEVMVHVNSIKITRLREQKHNPRHAERIQVSRETQGINSGSVQRR